jgi:hypothetical protein
MAPREEENEPAVQGMHVEGAVAPRVPLYVPAPQLTQAATEAAPVTFDQVPAGQGAASNVERGQ